MTSAEYFDRYIAQIDQPAYRAAITETTDTFSERILDTFDWVSFSQCLMYGDVQSGKTSHVLGIIGRAFDEGIRFALFLTSDNTRLVDQTFERILGAFPAVSVCNGNDEFRFRSTVKNQKNDQPVLIVLNKNKSVLERWKRVFSSTDAIHGKPLLIIDDEADAASLNAKVNQGQQTAINKVLTEIRDFAPSCIYLQVTGTPQANLLQAKLDGWRPDSILSFGPGQSYIGGAQLFDEIPNPNVKGFASGEHSESKTFNHAIMTYLITSVLLKELGDDGCNMLIHTSRQREAHGDSAANVEESISEFYRTLDTPETVELVTDIWENELQPLCQKDRSVDQVVDLLHAFSQDIKISTVVVNSDNKIGDDDALKTGFNVVIGGDSLGRGLTIPKLQTVFYSRTSKSPQADTLWQHARMFGYDRRLNYLRIFMPGVVLKTFHEVHKGNEAIKRQLAHNPSIDEINIDLGEGVRPTRRTVLNNDFLKTIVGGVNYFATDPSVPDMDKLDAILDKLSASDLDLQISTHQLLAILEHFHADRDDFALKAFGSILRDRLDNNAADQSWLLLRRNRKVRQGTGSLLSETDRKLGDAIKLNPVLTLYRIDQSLGWSSAPIWVPNLKLPNGSLFYRSIE
ncbi:stress-sensitive restriction system protein 2 [Corynebacterium deserti GIMN1.010]|uniref:Stress-sensitive restriction system protein 2 n=1 Tax=Corynebacterium deserti GIMN1.010 TaxID=931089 RepID=A0A0M3Q9F1_9CORY|nr:Z1 domain-containing protein [Corynebacterium deserti]ALC05559.1 stress-sensitive restriction system protein 2 [Corynebacterium deserti GIMN1.010]